MQDNYGVHIAADDHLGAAKIVPIDFAYVGGQKEVATMVSKLGCLQETDDLFVLGETEGTW